MENRFKKHYLLYYYLKIFGLCPFSLTAEGRPHFSLFGLFINCSLAFIFVSIYVIAYSERFLLVLPKETIVGVVVDVISTIFRVLTIFWAILKIGFEQRFLLEIYSDYKMVEFCLKKVTMNKSAEYHLRFAFARLVKPGKLCLYILFHIFTGLRLCVLLVFFEELHFIKNSFLQINRWLLNISEDNENIVEIIRLHVDICGLTEKSARFFSFIILCDLLDEFIQVSVSIYRINLYFKFEETWRIIDFVDFGSILFWLSVKMVILFLICALPDAVSCEAEKTYHIAHRKYCNQSGSQIKNKKCTEVFENWYQKKLSISLYGLFSLDFKCFKNIMATIIIYLVWMFQIEQMN
ncbi:uncharacterized protein LOC106658524 [Trichogramma pretiosum]|uniref:uncharacterized protein LOC106658524 n=1 Tax=Trichogramma pretiosum TaxID=7493 RepID=UPI0006C9B3C5|nr:uncharacterized protein LOC106658524 [Trichogramma pretiosum]